jgi:hypothetical protein
MEAGKKMSLRRTLIRAAWVVAILLGAAGVIVGMVVEVMVVKSHWADHLTVNKLLADYATMGYQAAESKYPAGKRLAVEGISRGVIHRSEDGVLLIDVGMTGDRSSPEWLSTVVCPTRDPDLAATIPGAIVTAVGNKFGEADVYGDPSTGKIHNVSVMLGNCSVRVGP